MTRTSTKTSIGKFYLAIDERLQERRSSPCNTYKFIEQLVSSHIPDSAIMSYGLDKQLGSLQAEVQDCRDTVQDLNIRVQEQQAEISLLQHEFERTKGDMMYTEDALNEMTAENRFLQRAQASTQKKLIKTNDMYQCTLEDLLNLEDDLLVSSELSKMPSLTSNCVSPLSNKSESEKKSQVVYFSLQTICGNKVYSNNIRQLYYSLLADQVPPAKIEFIIKSVMKCFLPSLNIDELKLPRERCAGYMRREELKMVSMAHKACTFIESDSLSLNSDGTTKCLKKINGVAMNGMVICLNEVPDGSADSIVEDISRELEKLREIASALNLPNPEKLNWTLISSSTSDSAASQKRFNRLLKQCQEDDENKFGPTNSDAVELVENLCAMHLGSNLRKAFLDGTRTALSKASVSVESAAQQREHDRTDTLIH